MKIGIFDSGIGGMGVLHEAYHRLPDNEYIFYADTDHVPYGLKTTQQIKGYADEIVRFLIDKGVDAIVVACNTATSVAIEDLRAKYDLPILGMEPAVKPAVEGTDKKRIMVIATPVTIRETKLMNLIKRVDENHRVDLLALPNLVTFAENEIFDGDQVVEYLEKEFQEYDTTRYCALVLGCTHFNYFKPLYRRFFDDSVELIDGNAGTVHHLADVLSLTAINNKTEVKFDSIEEMLSMGQTKYYASGIFVEDTKTLEHYRRLHNRLEEVYGLK